MFWYNSLLLIERSATMTNFLRVLFAAASLGIVIDLQGTAHATIVLDQEQVATVGSTSYTNGMGSGLAQTFSVGVGGVLQGIALGLDVAGAETELELLQTFGGVPTFNILATTTTISQQYGCNGSGCTPNLTYFNMNGSHIEVTAGEVLAIEPISLSVPKNIGHNSWELDISHSNPYIGGYLYYFNNPLVNNWTIDASQSYFYPGQMADAVFATYVENATAVPEPSSFLLIVTGLFFLLILPTSFRALRSLVVTSIKKG